MHYVICRIALAAALLTLGGCSMLGHPPTSRIESMRIVVEPGTNRDNATALDLVFVYDHAAEWMLPSNGQDWFAQKSGLIAALGDALDVVSLQLPAGTMVDPALPQRRRHAVAVYGYANYQASAGQVRLDLTPYVSAGLDLGVEGISVTGRL